MTKNNDVRRIKVIVSDADTGKLLETKVLQDDFMLIMHGRKWLKRVHKMGSMEILYVADGNNQDRK